MFGRKGDPFRNSFHQKDLGMKTISGVLLSLLLISCESKSDQIGSIPDKLTEEDPSPPFKVERVGSGVAIIRIEGLQENVVIKKLGKANLENNVSDIKKTHLWDMMPIFIREKYAQTVVDKELVFVSKKESIYVLLKNGKVVISYKIWSSY